MEDKNENPPLSDGDADASSSEDGGTLCDSDDEDGESDESSSRHDSQEPGGYGGEDPPMPITEFSSKQHFRDLHQPDNQLGLSQSESEPDPGCSPPPESRDEKLRAFWQKFVVKRQTPEPEPETSDTECVRNLEESLESLAMTDGNPNGVEDVPKGVDSDDDFNEHESDSDSGSHLSSETLHLSGLKRKRIDDEDTEAESDSIPSVVDQAALEEVLHSESKHAHSKRLSSASSKATLETPSCSRPDTCLSIF